MIARFFAVCPPPARVVDLGAGPGTDARLLGALGYTVTALDPSPEMVRVARARGVDARVAEFPAPGNHDAVLSGFGALNAAPDLDRVARALAATLRPGGMAVLVWMGPWCPAEALALLAAGHPREALRRRRARAVPVGGAEVPVRYWSPAEARRAFRRDFQRVHVEALGALMAPPALGGAPGRRTALEPWVAPLPGLRHLGDHTLHVYRRR